MIEPAIDEDFEIAFSTSNKSSSVTNFGIGVDEIISSLTLSGNVLARPFENRPKDNI